MDKFRNFGMQPLSSLSWAQPWNAKPHDLMSSCSRAKNTEIIANISCFNYGSSIVETIFFISKMYSRLYIVDQRHMEISSQNSKTLQPIHSDGDLQSLACKQVCCLWRWKVWMGWQEISLQLYLHFCQLKTEKV